MWSEVSSWQFQEDGRLEDRREEVALEWMVAAIIGRRVNWEEKEGRPVIAATTLKTRAGRPRLPVKTHYFP